MPYFPLVNVALGAILFFFVWKGADWAIRAQFFIMAVRGVSVIVFLAGPLGNFSLENLRANWGPLDTVHSLIPCFAIFFPAVTGIMAGGDGVVWCYIRGIIGVLLVVLAIDQVVEGIRALGRNKKAAEASK